MLNSSSPPITVIIPTFNRAGLLSGAIASVLSQNYPSFELIVVDDGSSDRTRRVVEGWERRLEEPAAGSGLNHSGRLRYLYQENRGPAAARNFGIRRARYDLLAFLDCDDRFRPGKLAIQAAAMTAAPEMALSHTEEIWLRRGEHLNQKKRHRKAGGELFARSLELCLIGMSTVIMRRDLLEKVGYFDETLPCCEDYELWLRVSSRFPVLFVEQPLTEKHGGRPDQLSVRHRVGMDRFRIRALEKLLAAGELTAEQARLARRELARKCRIYGRGCLKHGRPEEGRYYLELAAASEGVGVAPVGPEADLGVDGPEGAGKQEEESQNHGDPARVGPLIEGGPGEVGR